MYSVVVTDLRPKDEDKDEDLKTGPRGCSRTRTFLEDNNTVLYYKLTKTQ